MHGLKSAIVEFFKKLVIGWIGPALLVQPSKTAHRIFFSLLYFNLFFFKYETIVRNSASFGHSDPDPSSVAKLSDSQFEVLDSVI